MTSEGALEGIQPVSATPPSSPLHKFAVRAFMKV